MFFISLLVLHVSLNGVTSLSCLSCDHHHHHHDTFDPQLCTVQTCEYDQFCKMKVGHDYRVEGGCRNRGHHDKDLLHCYHDMKHWCADFRLALFHGECNYCCKDEDCVRRALNIVAPNQLSTTKATVAATTHVQQTAAKTPAATMAPKQQTTVKAVSCSNQCDDIATDCATTANVCSMKYGDLVCKKYCGLCGVSTVTTTLQPKCADHLKEDICYTMPGVCSNPLAHSICPRYCGFCHSGSKISAMAAATTAATPAPTTTATPAPATTSSKQQTNSVCKDHSPECLQPGVCSLQYGNIICPLTCSNCTAVTTTKKTVSSAQTTGHAITTPMQTTTHAATTTTHTVTASHHSGHKQHMCYQCGNYSTNDPCTMAELALGTPTPCSNGAYCMTDVFNTLTGDSEIIKRCVQKLECTRKWYDETSDRKACTSFDSVFLVPRLTCHFCCSGDGCNTDIVPAMHTLFRP